MRCAITSPQRQHAIVERYFGKATEAHVVFSRERHLVKAEISVHAGRGLSVQGGGEADDAYIAFDGAAERIDKRLRRNKRRLRNHHGRRQGRRRPPRCRMPTAYVLAAEDEAGEDAGEGEPLVIAEMRTRIPQPQRQRGGDAARSRRPAGAPVPQQRARQSQSGLSPPRRQYRLDRSRSRRSSPAHAATKAP